MSNVIKFPYKSMGETKEEYTWLELLFADSSPDKIVKIMLFSFGGDGSWHFMPVALIENLSTDKCHIYFYNTVSDKYFIDGGWDMDDDGFWCEDMYAHITARVKETHPDNYEVEEELIFGE